jgi:hypothetical protein
MLTVEPSNIKTRRPFPSHRGSTFASNARPTRQATVEKNFSGNRFLAWQ